MANIKSQIKRNRQNEKRRLRNQSVHSEVKTRVKQAEEAAGTDKSEETLNVAIRNIDKASAKGMIHKRTAARQKSRLIARIRKAS